MGPAIPVRSGSQPIPEVTTHRAAARNLVFYGLCIICDAVHGPEEQCPSLHSKVKIRLALDGLKMSAQHSKQPVDAIAIKRALLLEHLRAIEMGRV